MTERKWTKGPWFVDTEFDVVTDRGSVMLGSVSVRSDETSKANAHLTSAAPDLYEALEMCERLAGDLNIDEWQQVMDALAKARGEK